MSPVRLGVHVSILGGIEKAVLRARNWVAQRCRYFPESPGMERTAALPPGDSVFSAGHGPRDIDPIVVHTPYLINLATPDDDLYKRSTEALALDLNRAAQIGARYVVTHLGSSGEKGKGYGQERVAGALKAVLRQAPPVTLLLENSAGGEKRIGGAWRKSMLLSPEWGQSSTKSWGSALIPVTAMRPAMIFVLRKKRIG